MLSKSQVKLTRSVQQKKYRNQFQLYVVEGVKLMNELLLSGKKIHSIYCLEEWYQENEPELLKNKAAEIFIVNEKELKSVSSQSTPNQVLALVSMEMPALLNNNEKIILVLDAIRDPGNLGTIIRIADWFNISQIVCSDDCADQYNPKVIQASMGSIFRVQLIYEDIEKLILSQPERKVYAGMMEGNPSGKTIFNTPLFLLIGNESHGINPLLYPLITQNVTIEKRGNAESLNAAIACGILLHDIVNHIHPSG